jgi:hypothetical protein
MGDSRVDLMVWPRADSRGCERADVRAGAMADPSGVSWAASLAALKAAS